MNVWGPDCWEVYSGMDVSPTHDRGPRLHTSARQSGSYCRTYESHDPARTSSRADVTRVRTSSTTFDSSPFPVHTWLSASW